MFFFLRLPLPIKIQESPCFFPPKKNHRKNVLSHCDTKNDSKKGRKTCKMGPCWDRYKWSYIWVQFIMENPIKMDDLGTPIFWRHPKNPYTPKINGFHWVYFTPIRWSYTPENERMSTLKREHFGGTC